MLICYRVCEECGARLGEVSRLEYEPRFDPNGNDPYLTPLTPPDARRVTLSFDEFGWRSLESEADCKGETVGDLLGRAIAHLDAELGTSRYTVVAPAFKPSSGRLPRVFELGLPAGGWRRLSAEAGRQGIPLRRLLEHAPLLYLADVASKRVSGELSPGPTPARSASA